MQQMQQQQPTLIGQHSQQVPAQHQQHPSYHQLHSPHPHGPPVSHSVSPHPQQQQQPQNQQTNLAVPNSPHQQHHMHSHSPHHGGSSMHMQQQQQQMVRLPPGPQVMNHPQATALHQQQAIHHNHHQTYYNDGHLVHQQNLQQLNYTQPHNQHHQISQHQLPQHQQPQIHQQHQIHHHQQQQPHIHHQQQQQPPQHVHNTHSHHQTLLHHQTPQVPTQQPTHQPQQTLIQQQSQLTHQPISGNSPYHAPPTALLQTEVRIVEFNRRLQNRPISRQPPSPLPSNPFDESLWWEKFASDFFDDDATLTICVQEDNPNEYTIGRTLIPRFFRTYFDGGVSDLSIQLRNPKEANSHTQLISLVCDQALIITNHMFRHPNLAQNSANLNQGVVVRTEGRLVLEFVCNNFDTLSIKSWKFFTRSCREYIDRSTTTMGLPKSFLIEPLTRHGLTRSTITYLKMCMVMEPMQDLMVQNRQTQMDPRSCLKKLLYERYNFRGGEVRESTAATSSSATTTKRRKRTAAVGAINKKSKGNNNLNNGLSSTTPLISPGAIPNYPLASDSVMVVGEPSMMGSDFSDDNERTITRLENTQYDPSVAQPSNSGEFDKKEPKKDNLDAVKDEKEEVAGSLNNCSNNNDVTETLEGKVEIYESPPTVQSQQSRPPSQPQATSPPSAEEPSSQQSPVEQKIEIGESTSIKLEATQVEIADQSSQHETESVETQQNSEKSTQPDEKSQVSTGVGATEYDILNQSASDESIEKENDSAAILNDEVQLSAAQTTPSDTHSNIMSSIPEDREDSCVRSASCDLIVSKLPPNSNSKVGLPSNGNNNKQNRRRSSERKETLREGLMRTSDFVVAMKDLKSEHPALWRITTGNNLLQQFEPKTSNGVTLYENTNQYAGWNPDIKREYIGVDVKLTQHTRNQITVEKLHLNFQKVEDANTFYDKHFAVYLQILISTALDSKFWESIENEPEHHDYFLTSRRIVEDIIKRLKSKLSNKLKLSEGAMKNIEKYPNLLTKLIENGEKAQSCRACNTNTCTQIVTFENRSYDLHSYKPVKVTSEPSANDDRDSHNPLCSSCFEIVKIYSEIHHMGWKFFNSAREKAELHRAKGKLINTILDECMKDENWLTSIYAERDELWSKVENLI